MIPVVIIPGFYGTLLVDQAAQDRIVWLTLSGVFHSGEVLDAINLETGDPDRIVSDGILEEIPIFGHWAPNVYKDLTMFLGSLGFTPDMVIPFGVDWRRTLGFAVDQLHARISRAGKVNIIAHSHGGLVAREYLHRHGGELVDHLITFGTPHRGMLETFEALVQGIDFLKFSKDHLKKTARTFPSAYELLPPFADDAFFQWDGANADPFTNTSWADDSMKDKISAAGDVVKSLPQQLPVKTAIVYGTHLDTTALVTGGSTTNIAFRSAPVGDGTVPSRSAMGRGLTGVTDAIEHYAIPYGIHAHLFATDAAKTIMKNILFDRPMPYFAFGFSHEMYMAGEPLGVAVDVRGPQGTVLDDADVRITIAQQEIPMARDDMSGDYFVTVDMPLTPEHLQYKIVARSAKLSSPFVQVGLLHPLNV